VVVLIADRADLLRRQLLAGEHAAKHLAFIALGVRAVESRVQVVPRLFDEGLRGLCLIGRGHVPVDVDHTPAAL
jgi:hypothetical protein